MTAPTDIETCARQLAALRAAARYRNPATGRRHFCHNSLYRAAYVRGIRELRDRLRELSVGAA